MSMENWTQDRAGEARARRDSGESLEKCILNVNSLGLDDEPVVARMAWKECIQSKREK